jgi:phenylacetate-CoA ligase
LAQALEHDRFATLRRTQKAACERAPAIREVYVRAGITPQELHHGGDLARLPVTSKDNLLALQRGAPPFGGFLAADLSTIRRIFVSPGPIYEPQLNNDSTGHGFARVFREAGIGPGDRVLNTWSYHMVPAGLLLDDGIAATGATVVPGGPGGAEHQAQLILELGVTCICASTAFFFTLVESLERMGHELPAAWNVRAAMLGGEMGDWQGTRRRLESRYGIRTFSAYATGDFGVIGYEESGSDGYAIHPERLVQICDPRTGDPLPAGQQGEIVVTTLDEGWPLVRFGTGDVAIALEQSADGCASRISGLLGRVGQGVKVREVFVYPRNVEDVVTRVAAIQRAQLVVRREGNRETVVLRTEIKPGTSPEIIRPELDQAFRHATRLKLDTVEWLATGALDHDAALLVDQKYT